MTSRGEPEGFVLAGGRSSRFGEDKAAWELDGVACAARVGEALRAVCGRVRIVRRAGQAPRLWLTPGGERLDELRGEEGSDPHPLWGVAAALEAAESAWVILAPCDLPDLADDAVRALWAVGCPAVATDGREQPLLMVAPRDEAERARALARAGAAVGALVQGWARVRVAGLRNMNRP